MGLLGGILSRAKAATRSVSLLRVMGLPGDSVAEVSSANYAAAYAINPYVFTAIDRIAEAACTVPLVLEQRNAKGEWEAIASHPLLDLLEFVNDEEDEFSILYGTVAWLLLTGDAYWVKLRASRTGPPAGLQLIPAQLVTIKRDKGGDRVFEVDLGSGRRQTLPAADVIHFRTFNPLGSEHGLSRIAPLEQTINLFTRLMSFNTSWLKNGGVPSLFLKLQSRMTDEQWKRFVADYRAWRSNGELAGVPFQIDASSEVHEIGANPDSHLSSSMIEKVRDTILGVIGCPPATAGVFEYANYANSREQTQMFWTQAVQPVLRLVTSGLKSQLVPDFGKGTQRIRLRYAVEQVPAMQPNQAEMVTAARDAIGGGVYTPNEARKRYLSEEGVGPAGDALYLPRNLVPLADERSATDAGSESEEPRTPGPSFDKAQDRSPDGRGETDEGEGAEETPQRSPEGAAVRIKRTTARRTRRVSDEARRAIYKGFNRERDTHVARVRRTVAQWLEDLCDDARAWIRRQPSLATERALRVRVPSMDDMFDAEASAEALASSVGQEVRRIYQSAGQTALNQVAETSVDFDIETYRFQRLLRERTLRMRTVARDKQAELRSVVAEGLAAGENVIDLVNRVEDYTEAGKERYAETVARTEVGTAMNRGALEGYRQGGATGKEWLSIQDDRTRSGHAALDGQVAPIDEPFTLDTEDGGTLEVDGPQDPDMDPADACNCRCTSAPAWIDEEGDK